MEFNSDFWNLIKDKIKARNKDQKLIETWLNPVTYVETSGTSDRPQIILGVPSELHRYFVVENVLEKIYSEISELYKGPFGVDVTIVGSQSVQNPSTLSEAFSNSDFIQPKKDLALSPAPMRSSLTLNPEYTFSTFVVGKNTEFAHAASYNVANNPGAEGYNPLFIYGPPGMGKTHLLHAVGNQILRASPHLKIIYFTAEKFLNECVSAIRRSDMDKFRQKYRESGDVLLVDDVQYIGKGDATQEEFFHTINAFMEKRKQVVVASDRMPKDILNLEDRNRSRLEWGLIADITMPDYETRVAILRYKAERLGVRLTEEVISYIARISKRSIRELEGNLKKIKMFSELQGLSIDIDLAKRVLASHETQTSISVEDILKMVADHYKVKIPDLKSATRAKQIVVPRQISMYLIKKNLDKSLVDIGRTFGNRDHTTVMNALDRVDHLQSKDLTIKNDIDELMTRIHNITGL